MQKKIKSIAFPHPPGKTGGPGSFQTRFEKELEKRGVKIFYGPANPPVDVVLVIGGTKRLKWLADQKKSGALIVHRLDGKLWQHRVSPFNFRNFLYSELRQSLVSLIRAVLADGVIYQSRFVKGQWSGSVPRKESTVIPNGVDLEQFSPVSFDRKKPDEREAIICVEGSVNGAVNADIMATLSSRRMIVFGHISKPVRDRLSNFSANHVVLMGSRPRSEISSFLRDAGVFLNLELFPPCPNAVIEALACGVPVVGFDTGSLKEIVGLGAGTIVPADRNLADMQLPDCAPLEKGIEHVFENYSMFSNEARNRAVLNFDIQRIVDQYFDFFKKVSSRND